MTGKRFTFEFDNYNGRLFDDDYQTFYHIEDSEENIELLCNRLNALHEENIEYKQELEQYENIVNLTKEVGRMTEKRFIQPNKECRVIKNTKTGETAIYYDTEDGLMFLKWLNNLSDENEQLKGEVAYYKLLLMSLEEQAKRITENWKVRK